MTVAPLPDLPRYSPHGDWKPDEDDVARAHRPVDDTLLRALSVAPFVLVGALGLMATIGWMVVVVFGLAAPGSRSAGPVWRWAQGQDPWHVLWQLVLAVGIGLIPLTITLAAGWATVHGFRRRPHALFWPTAQLFWGIVAIGLIAADRLYSASMDDLGVGTLDRWFGFLLVAAAAILAGVRHRRERRERLQEGKED